MGRPKEPIPSPPLLSPSSLPQREGLPDVEVSMVEAEAVTGVTFTPELWMQRRHWALDVLRKEGVRSVLDVGAGPGALLETLIQPPATINEKPLRSKSIAKQQTNGTASSSSTSGGTGGEGEEPELFINRLAALDPNPNVLPVALSILSPQSAISSLPISSGSNPFESSASTASNNNAKPPRRFQKLTTELWLGGIESYNQHLEGYEAMVALEVIEHLDPNVLSRFGVVCLGTYRPRLLLISTPNFDFNAKFPRHDDHEHGFAQKGFMDPTGRTERVFRHSDHKLEMTSSEFRSWATSAAQDWGYEVHLSGVGISSSPSYYPSDHPTSPSLPIYASQVALFRLASGIPARSPRSVRSSELPWLSKEAAHPHKLVGRFMIPPTVPSDILAKRAGVREVRGKVRELMQSWRVGTVSLGELWGNDDLSGGMCGGSKRYLVGALGGWGDQERLNTEMEGGEDEEDLQVKSEEGGRGLIVVWKGFKEGGREEENWGQLENDKKDILPPSEATGGW